MAKVAAKDGGRTAAGFKREREIARAAANIQHLSAGPFENRRHARHRAGAPEAIDIHRQQMIQQVVARSDPAEHSAHPGRSLLLGFGAGGCRALGFQMCQQTSASSMAAVTNRSCTSAVILTAPMRSGRTKWILPWTVFLSLFRRDAMRAGSISASGGNGP